MLFDLKIETIGKIIFTVLVVTLSVLTMKYLPLSFTYAADGNSPVVTFVPENTIPGSNRLQVWLNTDGYSPSVVTLKYQATGIGAITTIIPTTSPLKTISLGDNSWTLFQTGAVLPAGNTHLLTVVADINGSITSDGTFNLAIGSKMSLNGADKPIPVPTTAYTVKKNVAPAVIIDVPMGGNTPAIFTTPIEISVNDPYDNQFTRTLTLRKKINNEYVDIPFASKYQTNSFAISNTFTHRFDLNTNQYLDYSSEYQVEIKLTDDQQKSTTVTKDFKTERDTGRPNKVSFANMTKSIWSTNPADNIIDVTFERAEDSTGGGKIRNYFIFNVNTLTNEGLSAFSFDINSGYFGFLNQDQMVSTIRTAINNGTYMASFAQPSDPTQKILTMSILKSKISQENYMSEIPFVLVVTDDARNQDNSSLWEPNISDPVMVVKPGDYVMNEYKIPDGLITLEDVIYSFRNSTYSSSCPIPARSGGYADGTVKNQCR